MNIGIDFDNTIAKYDNLFKEVAVSEGFINYMWNGNGKTELRDHLRKQPDGETTWMKLQGLIYGKFMHRAELMPGVANFLMQCRLHKHTVFVVSHKTEFGHFDPEKISLRQEALKWMKAKRFFDPEYLGINKENIFFADTREEKAEKIAQLKCDFFIDDLPEVFAEPQFPSGTKKILFDRTTNTNSSNTIKSLNSWRKISHHIFGDISTADIFLWVNSFFQLSKVKIQKKLGRGNSRIYKLTAGNEKKYALKVYPDRSNDSRQRLKTEFTAITFLNHNGLNNIPKAMRKDEDLNMGIYSWVDGSAIQSPDEYDLEQAIEFIRRLHILSKKSPDSFRGLASEACLSAKNLVDQIELRLKRLQSISINKPALKRFLDNIFSPLWVNLKQEVIKSWPASSREKNLEAKYRILSPSDFGFHNALKKDSQITFIDFEYFGWDDPVKLTADFIWHPGMNLNSDLITIWKEAMLDIFSGDPDFVNRFNVAMPLYGMRWVMILLNEFLPGFTQRRQNAGQANLYNEKKAQSTQLSKAKLYCERMKRISSQLTYA